MRTFARTADVEAVEEGLADEHAHQLESARTDEGVLNVAGFVLTAQTIADLEALDVTELPLPDAERRRVLLLGRDTLPPDRRLRAHFERHGVALTVEPGRGYDTTIVDPYLSRVPNELLERMVAWVEEGEAEVPAPAAPGEGAAALADSVELNVAGQVIRERPFEFDFNGERLSGVLTEPVSVPEADVCALLLNAGALRRLGPHRMWVEAARRWAVLGVPSLRFDIVGVGDSDGDSSFYTTRGAFQREHFAQQVIAALDELEAAGLPGRFAICGICSGAYWALHTALNDERVDGLLLLNILAFFWRPELGAARDARRAKELLAQGELWRVMRIVATERWRITRMLASARHRLSAIYRPDLRAARPKRQAISVLDRMRDRDIDMLLFLSQGEPLYDDFVADGIIDRLAQWPNVRLERVGTAEHIFSLVSSQRHVHDIIDAAIVRTVRRRAS